MVIAARCGERERRYSAMARASTIAATARLLAMLVAYAVCDMRVAREYMRAVNITYLIWRVMRR